MTLARSTRSRAYFTHLKRGLARDVKLFNRTIHDRNGERQTIRSRWPVLLVDRSRTDLQARWCNQINMQRSIAIEFDRLRIILKRQSEIFSGLFDLKRNNRILGRHSLFECFAELKLLKEGWLTCTRPRRHRKLPH